MCRREAGEREKTTRAGDDGKGKARGSNCGGESLVMPPTMAGCLLSKVLIFERGSFLNEPGVEALSLLSSGQ